MNTLRFQTTSPWQILPLIFSLSSFAMAQEVKIEVDAPERNTQTEGGRPTANPASDPARTGDADAAGRNNVTSDTTAGAENLAPGQPSERRNMAADFGARFEKPSADGSLIVSNVERDSKASTTGLQSGDRIVAIDGSAVSSEEQFNNMLNRLQDGSRRVPLVIRREGRDETLYIESMGQDSTRRTRSRLNSASGLSLRLDDDNRLTVSDVVDGLAAIAGIRRNDVIVSIDGRRVTSPNQVEQFMDDLNPRDGRRLPIIVMRNGRRITLHLDPDSQQSAYQDDGAITTRSDDGWLGVTLDPQSDDGAVVRSVMEDSPGEQAGLRTGDWILRVNGRRVRSATQLTNIISSMQPGDSVDLEIARRVTRKLVATLDQRPSSLAEEPRQEDDYWVGRRNLRQRDADRLDRDFDRRGLRDRIGPRERGLRDRLDDDNIREETFEE